MSWLDWLFGQKKSTENKTQSTKSGLRAVPGAGAYSKDGKVIYNMLDPEMGQFMGRCVGAVKKAGIKAKGTGQFSISLNDGKAELNLDQFYSDYCNQTKQLSEIFDEVVKTALSELEKSS